MSVEGYVTDMLVRCSTSDELHEQVTCEKTHRQAQAALSGALDEDKQYEIDQHARNEHKDIERAVDWIEAHPQATEWEVEQ